MLFVFKVDLCIEVVALIKINIVHHRLKRYSDGAYLTERFKNYSLVRYRNNYNQTLSWLLHELSHQMH